MKKIAGLAFTFALSAALLAGCGGGSGNSAAGDAAGGNAAANQTADAMTSASVVNTNDAFLKAIGADGTWIIATLNDLTFDQDLVLEGDFTNKDAKARKIALYTQDADHNITASFKLTAPKLTVKSENARIQGGTFVGDVYVEAPGFKLVDATIEGNLYFASEELQSTFDASDNGKVTGVTEVKAAE
ncbi:hypothetical protein EHV15_16760 [Paenibacillus oralis]|uniref:Polymer-forming cytoskeletal protein n=1 Tax=Paenibacillus oralis TaxID=2490856 RepID=A0A3P3U219_9BACL|nr:hypothetical protein [Paenibacillus oralis]RRJ64387.1 hypothetical protein EHV15_16760 [Paenibacillus oralis]